MTCDEMKLRNVAAMGEALGEQHTILFREVTTLHLYWKEFLSCSALMTTYRPSEWSCAGVLPDATRTAIRDKYAAYGVIDRSAEVHWER